MLCLAVPAYHAGTSPYCWEGDRGPLKAQNPRVSGHWGKGAGSGPLERDQQPALEWSQSTHLAGSLRRPAGLQLPQVPASRVQQKAAQSGCCCGPLLEPRPPRHTWGRVGRAGLALAQSFAPPLHGLGLLAILPGAASPAPVSAAAVLSEASCHRPSPGMQPGAQDGKCVSVPQAPPVAHPSTCLAHVFWTQH